jgi:CO/xanthine dehydrogenase FAD-binding subunit
MSADQAYVRPSSLEGALEALAAGPVKVGAGFTDIYPATERKVLPGRILDVAGLEELRGISETPKGLRIGAATTWSEIAGAALPPALHGLQRAARAVGGRQIQNRGTIGGNLCNASPAADGVPPLLTLDAQVELRSAEGGRDLPLSDFITGPRQTGLRPGELLLAVHLPRAALAGRGAFVKLGAREYLVISIAMAAVRLVINNGTVVQAAVAVGACGPAAVRLPAIEGMLTGRAPDPGQFADADVAAALSPITDVRADAAYREEAAASLLRRAIAEAAA